MLRLVGYIEIGKRETKDFEGKKKFVDKVKLIFEVFGPKYPPRVMDGQNVPLRVTVFENLSMYNKSNYYKKLFLPMSGGDPSVKHTAQLLGRPFSGKLFHKKTGAGRTIATLQDPNTKDYTIGPPVFSDPMTGETKTLAVPPAVSPIRCFIWDQADKAMWDSIYIGGQVGGRSANVFQEDIKLAVNYKGSHVEKLSDAVSNEVDDYIQSFEAPTVDYSDDDPFGYVPPQEAQQGTADQAAAAYSNRFRRGK